MGRIYKIPPSIEEYERKHGFDKTKAMIEFYDVPIWEYADKIQRGEKIYCHDCGIEIEEMCRCKACHELAKSKL